jgi:hypothetical protein
MRTRPMITHKAKLRKFAFIAFPSTPGPGDRPRPTVLDLMI